jgi:hypothetical protein
MKIKFSEMYKIKMNALIDLTKCRKYLTINMGGRDHRIRLCGTIDDPYFCGRDVCEVLGYKDIKQALQKHVKPKHKNELKSLNPFGPMGPKGDPFKVPIDQGPLAPGTLGLKRLRRWMSIRHPPI